MFQTAPGVTIPFPDKIQEEFKVYDGKSIYANISFEKLKPILTEFYHSLPNLYFLYFSFLFSCMKNERRETATPFIKRYAILTDRQKVRLTILWRNTDKFYWKTACLYLRWLHMSITRKCLFKSTSLRRSIPLFPAVLFLSYSVTVLRKPIILSLYGTLFHRKLPVNADVFQSTGLMFTM